MKRRWIALALLACLLLSGCASGKSATPMAAPAAEAPAAAMPQMAMEEAMATEAAYAYDTAAGGASDQGTGEYGLNGAEINESNYGGRKIIRTISLEINTDDFDDHLAQLIKNAQTAGGYVSNSYVYGTKPEVVGDNGRNASYTFRIPEAQADAFIKSASGCGTLISQNENTDDVTDSYFDVETRLSVYRTTLERLESILVKTNDLSDILELEQEIARVTIEIEDLTTKLRKYDGLIAYATVNVSLYEERIKIGPAAKTAFGQRVSEGFSETLSDMGNFLEDLAVFLISALPVLIPLGLIAWLIVWLVRKREKKTGADGMSPSDRRAARKAAKLARQNAMYPAASNLPDLRPKPQPKPEPKEENHEKDN